MSAQIEVADDSSDAAVAELTSSLERLLPQLSSSPPPTAAYVRDMIDDPMSTVFVARLDGRVVGALTLVYCRIPTGIKAWIEDVVVDDAARGHGIGEALNRAALDSARDRGVKGVSLTSRPSREAANRLYQRIGFTARQTNVYRYDF